MFKIILNKQWGKIIITLVGSQIETGTVSNKLSNNLKAVNLMQIFKVIPIFNPLLGTH